MSDEGANSQSLPKRDEATQSRPLRRAESNSRPLEGRSRPVGNHSRPLDRGAAHSQPLDRSTGKSQPLGREDAHSRPLDRGGAHSKPLASSSAQRPKQHVKPHPQSKPEPPAPAGPASAERPHPGRFTRRQRARMQRVRSWAVTAFYGVLVVGMVVGLAFFARPTASALENRNLTQFPELTWESFWSGSFFSDLSLWYADTYPPREFIMGLDKQFKSLYGIQSDVTMVGGVQEAEEVPEAPAEEVGTIDVEQFTAPDADALAQEVQNSIMDGLYVHDGAAYSKYYFTESVATKYASIINTLAAKLEGKAEVFSILVPDQSSVMLSDEELRAMGGSSQSDAIRYYDSLMSDQVKKVNAFDTLREHNDEYLYFRTDHHWTELGAYYTYVKFCEKAGIEPVSLDDKELMQFDGFLGSFYQKLSDPAMAANPDEVDAHVPFGTNAMRYLDRDGNWVDAKVITDVSAWNKGSKYQCFIAGDQPLVEIENPQVEDDSSVLLVKESFGNAFAPLLVDSFHRVYVIDYRYYLGNIVDFVEQNGIKDVIVMNNITHASTNGVTDKLASLM